jgi:hypothetical protein
MEAITINAAAKPVTIQYRILAFFICSSFCPFARRVMARVDVPKERNCRNSSEA